MDSFACNNCLTLSRKSSLYAFVVATLMLASVKASAIKLREQSCKPRPVVVGDQTGGNRPYNILLHRCSGTCDDTQPERKPCTALITEEIDLIVKDPSNGVEKTIQVHNHTSCGCDCGDLDCDFHKGEFLDADKCMCTPNAQPSGNKPETGNILPYKIGLGVMGLVALCGFVFGMMVCIKRKKHPEEI